MEVEKLNNKELRELFYKIKAEIDLRGNEYKTMLREQKNMRNINYLNTVELIKFISQELGYDVCIKSRKPEYVMVRHALYLYLRNLDNYHRCSILDLAEILNCNHSTIIVNARTAQDLKETNHYDYVIAEDRLTQIIKKFNNLKTNQNGEQKSSKSTKQVQQLVKPIKKDAANPFFKSSYASLDHIQEHIKPTLIECGLVVIQRNVYSDNANQLFVESKVVEVESGEWESSLFPVVVNKTDAQSYGSAVSYAKRYSLSGLLNLTIQDQDDDAQRAVEPTKEETIWLTDDQFKKALQAEPKQIKAVLTKYTQKPYAIKKEYREQLTNLLNA